MAIRPSYGAEGDPELVDRTLKEDVPTVLDYLERAPAERFRFAAFDPDIAPACFFRKPAGTLPIDGHAARRRPGWRVRCDTRLPKARRHRGSVLRTPIADSARSSRRSCTVSAEPMRRPHAARHHASTSVRRIVLCLWHVMGALPDRLIAALSSISPQ